MHDMQDQCSRVPKPSVGIHTVIDWTNIKTNLARLYYIPLPIRFYPSFCNLNIQQQNFFIYDLNSYLPDAWEVFYGLDKVDVGCGNVGASIQAGEAVVILCEAAPKSHFHFCLKNPQKNKTCGTRMIRRISMRTKSQGRISSLEKPSGGSFRQSKSRNIQRRHYLLFLGMIISYCGYWTIKALTVKSIEKKLRSQEKVNIFSWCWCNSCIIVLFHKRAMIKDENKYF